MPVFSCSIVFVAVLIPLRRPPRLHHGHADVADSLQSHGDVFADAFDLDHG